MGLSGTKGEKNGGWGAVSATFSCDRTQKYLYEIKLMGSVDVLLIYTMSSDEREGKEIKYIAYTTRGLHY